MARKNAAPEPAAANPSRSVGGHAVLEASAGTGKTYAMVAEVRRLLVEDGLRLPQILVLTFTEKAAADLRRRVRAGLQAAWQAAPVDSPAAAALGAALAAWPQAAIFTLHGFCNRVLHEFGFENGLPFQLTPVDDGEVLETALREIQRAQWPAWYGAQLPAMLALSGYPQRQQGVSEWETRLLRLAGEVRLEAGMRLEPAGAETFQPADLGASAAKLAQAVTSVAQGLAGADSQARAEDWYGSLQFSNHRRRKKTVACMQELLEFPGRVAAWVATLDQRPYDRPALRDDQVDYLTERLAEVTADAGRRRLTAALAALAAWQQALDVARHSLMIRTLAALRPAARLYKFERGLLSFDDMIEQVARHLGPAADGSLCAALRARYRCALVDEFQDTDLLQWHILHRIFVADADPRTHRLTIIGDPKQSIYRFRRADIHTYLLARQMLGGGQPTRTLGVNWRSTPELIAALNQFFGGVNAAGAGVAGDWFFRDRTRIAFEPVQPPPPTGLRSRLVVDTTARGPLTVMRQPVAKVGLQRWRQARWMAAEIGRLLAGGGTNLQFATDDPARPVRSLEPGDIAILAPRRKMIPTILAALEAAGIAATTYKQAGLFASDEALAVVTVLRAVERPGDRARLKAALLTPFFACRPEHLERFDGFPPGHPAPQLLSRWAQWAAEGRWSRLAASLLRETGLIGRALTAVDGDRRLSNLRQVLEYFAAIAYGRKLSLPAAIRALVTAAEQDAAEETDLQRIDTERSKVQVMTVHASKGLEFPVVFLAEVADPHAVPEFRWQFHAADGALVYDLAQSAANKSRHQAEVEEEAARLYYVALTRARFKLFLPRFEGNRDPLAFGARLAQVFPPPPSPGPAGAPPQSSAEAQWLDWDDSLTLPPRTASLAPAAPLAPPPLPPRDLPQRRLAIESFTHLRSRWQPTGSGVGEEFRTGLAAHRGAPAAEFSDRDLFDEAIDERLEAALLTTSAVGERREEPGGVAFGTLVHDVLESVDFATVARVSDPAALAADPPTAALIAAAADRAYGLPGAAASQARRQAAIQEAARLVWLALRTPLPLSGPDRPGVPLAALPPADCLRELEFQYALSASTAPAAPSPGEGQVYGFIDMLFRRRPAPGQPFRYYLLDWKTNRLEDYSPAGLAHCMQAEGYHLQHRLYTLGMLDWLATRLPGFDPARDFGGVAYLFLRGLNGRDSTSGVFFAPPPSPADLAAQRQQLQAAIGLGDVPAGQRLLAAPPDTPAWRAGP